MPIYGQVVADNTLSFRNKIINGDMRIAQRATSVSSISSTGYRTIDRMSAYYGGNDQLVFTHSQESDAPSGSGFTKSLKVQVTTAETATESGDLFCPIFYKFEGQDLQDLGYGTASAKSVTLSFWVKTNVTGTYTVSFYKTFSSNRVVSRTFTVNSAGTWEYKTVTIPGDTSVGISDSTAVGMEIYINALVGPNYTNGTEATSWSSYVTSNWAVGHTADWGRSTNDYIQFTGVQLEVGSVATPFERRPYDTELALCLRYFVGSEFFSRGRSVSTNSSGRYIEVFPLPVPMRGGPTLTWTRTGARGADGFIIYPSGDTTQATSVGTKYGAQLESSPYFVSTQFYGSSTSIPGAWHIYNQDSTASASAEL